MGQFLSRFGVGSATVETVLSSYTVQPGTNIDAEVIIRGGSSKQKIESINFALAVEPVTDHDQPIHVIKEETLTEPIEIDPDETRRFPATIHIPQETPVTTLGSTRVWVETDLEIEWAVDPDDRDELIVEPTAALRAVLDAFEGLSIALIEETYRSLPASLAGAGREFNQFFLFGTHGAPFNERFSRIGLTLSRKPDTTVISLLTSRSVRTTEELIARGRGVSHHTVEIADGELSGVRNRIKRELRETTS